MGRHSVKNITSEILFRITESSWILSKCAFSTRSPGCDIHLALEIMASGPRTPAKRPLMTDMKTQDPIVILAKACFLSTIRKDRASSTKLRTKRR